MSDAASKRWSIAAGALAAAWALGCSAEAPAPSQGRDAGGGDGGASGTRPRAAVVARLAGMGTCDAELFTLGAVAKPVDDGAGASVACTVRAAQGKFVVQAKVVPAGTVAKLEIQGQLVASGAPGDVRASFADLVGTSYERASCSVTFPAGGGIAAGRVWMKVACPVEDTCPISAELKLENCAQE